MKDLKVKIHMCASEVVNPRIRIVKAARRKDGLKGLENTDGTKIATIPASAPVNRSDTTSLRANWLVIVETSLAGAATIGLKSDMDISLNRGLVLKSIRA
jgi:hypothetical protein